MAAHQAPLSLGFSRQEHWSGLPFSSPMRESKKWKLSCSVVSDLATPWTAAYQAPPSMGFSRQEYWSGVPLPSLPYLIAAAAAKSLQSCPTLCNPIDGSPPGSPVPGILQARTLEWVVISFSNAWNWKVKVKSFSGIRLVATPWLNFLLACNTTSSWKRDLLRLTESALPQVYTVCPYQWSEMMGDM